MRLSAFILIVAFFASFISRGQDTTCKDKDLGKVEFERNSSILTAKARVKLDSLIVLIKSKPNCAVLAISSSADFCDKCGALSWDRQCAVINYLAKNGISKNRLISYARLEGNLDFVILRLKHL